MNAPAIDDVRLNAATAMDAVTLRATGSADCC